MMRARETKLAERPLAPPPRPDPLSDRALQQLLAQLETRERELQDKIADERNRLQNEWLTLDGEVGDDVDRAFVKTQVGLERDIIDRCLNQLNEIAATHDRIASGDIGICADCGERIEAARLDVNPVASRCTECQERSEKIAHINDFR